MAATDAGVGYTTGRGVDIAGKNQGGRIYQSVVAHGVNDSGDVSEFPVTAEGHLEVAVHAPRMPFGAVHTEGLHVEFQQDFVYGISSTQSVTTLSGTGGASASGGLGTVSTGTSAGSFGVYQSRKRLRYRAGQASVVRFTALYSAPATNGIQIAGCGTDEAGIYFGYYLTGVFGILHVTGGVREIRTLTVSTASTATNNYNVELNGTTFNVTATNNGSTVKTAYEIAQGTYTGWTAQQIGSTVVFLANQSGPKAGAFSLGQSGAATPAAGSFATTTTGVNTTNTFVPQSEWNGDKLDGTGPSGITLDPAKGNVFEIGIEYLGFGATTLKVEVNPSGNNPDFVIVHTMDFPNKRTAVVYSQPAFPFTMTAYSAGSTTNITVSCGSYAGFIGGEQVLSGPRFSLDNATTGVSTTLVPLFTLRNNYTYASRANQAVVRLLSIAGAMSHTKPGKIRLLKDAPLTGTPNFTALSSGSSCCSIDTAATGLGTITNAMKIVTLPLGGSGNASLQFADTVSLQPGEAVTVAVVASSGSGADFDCSLNIREDQ